MPVGPRKDKPRACVHCFKSKAKCVAPRNTENAEEQACQRCAKNGLSCSRFPNAPKRKRGKAIRTQVMEEKLDVIISLLSRGGDDHVQADSHDAGQSISGGLSSSSSNTVTPSASSASSGPDHLFPTEHTGNAVPDASLEEGITFVPGYSLSFDEADQALRYYADELLPQFPFVPLPACSSAQIYRTSPLLLKVILRVCHPLEPKQDEEFSRWFRQHVSHRTVVLMEKTTEILQSILVFVTWNVVQFYITGSDTALVQIAIGIVGELGLLKRPGSSTTILDEAMHFSNDPRHGSPQHTNAGRRAALGVFFISSVLSIYFDKLCRVEYTPYLDECCDLLLHAQQFDTDALLVYMIRTRKIALKVSNLLTAGNADRQSGMGFTSHHAMAISTLQRELEAHLDSLPEPVKSNPLIRNDCAAIRIRILEPAITASPSDKPDPTLMRPRVMWDCLVAVKDLYDSLLSFPAEQYSSFAFVTMVHFAIALVTSIKLLRLDDHDWDKDTARRFCDLTPILQQLEDRYSAAYFSDKGRSKMVTNGRPLMARYADRMRWLKDWYAAQVAPRADDLDPTMQVPGPIITGDQGFDLWCQFPDMSFGLGVSGNEFAAPMSL